MTAKTFEDHRGVLLLVVEDEPTSAFLADNLGYDGYQVLVTDELEAARVLAANHYPDVALVDVNAGSGLRFARAVRSERAAGVNPGLPLVLLGSQDNDELEALRSFEAGADDYVRKPFSYSELRARIEALLRRVDRARRGGRRLRIGELSIDRDQRTVTVAGRPVDQLSAKEFSLLCHLAKNPTKVYTKDELLRAIWASRRGQTRTLDSHACRLRHKLAAAGPTQRLVINVWGVGYRLTDSDDTATVARPDGEPKASS